MNYRFVKTRKWTELVRVLIIFILIFSMLTMPPLAAASDLDEFEEAATTEKTDHESDNKESQAKDDDDCLLKSVLDVVFITAFLGIIFIIIDEGTKISLARIEEGVELEGVKVEPRQTGEATLPFFQYEHKYLRVNSDLDARENGLEIGYGPYGFSCRHTEFREENPSDELSLTQYHLLLRISRTSSREFGLGIGSLVMHGNDDNSGLSLTFPIKLYPSDSLGVRFKPTFSWINGNAIDEYDLSLAYTKRYASLQLGYRALVANGKDLDGPYLGLIVHY